MSWLYELRDIANKYPLVWVFLFVLITVIVQLIAYFITKKIEKKHMALAIIVSTIITASTAAFLNLGLGTPVIKNDESIIPEDLYRSQYKIVLYDYYGEYYYPPNSNEVYYITGNLETKASKLELLNCDYDVIFNTYSAQQNNAGLYEYIFDNIPTGNYKLNISVDGYLNRSEDIVLDPANTSVDFITNEKWWTSYPNVVANNSDLAFPMNVWFLDSNEKPVSNLSYEFINSPRGRGKGRTYTYPKKTTTDGSINENIRIIDNKEFWIAYVNPYTEKEEIICVTANINRDVNKCDAILMFDDNGNLKQTSPEELWY